MVEISAKRRDHSTHGCYGNHIDVKAEGGACSNGIALLLYWSDTHTYARAAQINPAFFSTHTQNHSDSRHKAPPPHSNPPRHAWSQRSVPWREPHAALERILGQPNYSCANMYASSSCIHRRSRRIQRITQNIAYAWPRFSKMHSWAFSPPLSPSCLLPL